MPFLRPTAFRGPAKAETRITVTKVAGIESLSLVVDSTRVLSIALVNDIESMLLPSDTLRNLFATLVPDIESHSLPEDSITITITPVADIESHSLSQNTARDLNIALVIDIESHSLIQNTARTFNVTPVADIESESLSVNTLREINVTPVADIESESLSHDNSLLTATLVPDIESLSLSTNTARTFNVTPVADIESESLSVDSIKEINVTTVADIESESLSVDSIKEINITLVADIESESLSVDTSRVFTQTPVADIESASLSANTVRTFTQTPVADIESESLSADTAAYSTLAFDGSTTRLDLPTPVFGGLAEFTASIWVHPTTGNTGRFISEFDGAASNIFFYTDATKWHYGVKLSNTAQYNPTSTANVVFDTWTQITITYESALLSLYIDGVFDSSLAVPGGLTVSAGAADTQIGAYWGGGIFADKYDGDLASPRVWSRKLDSAEIPELYNNGFGLTTDDMSLHLKSGLVLDIACAEDLPTVGFQAEVDAIVTSKHFDASYSGGTFTDTESNAITEVSTSLLSAEINGKDVMDLDGSASHYKVNSLASAYNADYEGFFIVRDDSEVSFSMLSTWTEFADASAYTFFELNSSDPFENRLAIRNAANSAYTNVDNGEETVDGGFTIVDYRLDAGTAYLSINGVETSISVADSFTANDTVTRGALVRTGNPSGTFFMNGAIAHDMVYDPLSAADRELVRNLLTALYLPLHDLSSSRNHATPVGSPTFTGALLEFQDNTAPVFNVTLVADIESASLSLDTGLTLNDTLLLNGISQVLDCGTDDSLDFGTAVDFSFSIKFKTTDTDGFLFMKQENTSNFQGFFLKMVSGKLVAGIRDSAGTEVTATSVANMDDDEWHSGLATFDRSGNMSLVVDDGTPVTASISALGDITVSNIMRVGVSGLGGDIFGGSLATLRLWDRVLTVANITEDHNDGYGLVWTAASSILKQGAIMAVPIHAGDGSPYLDDVGNNDAVPLNSPTFTGDTLIFRGETAPAINVTPVADIESKSLSTDTV